MTTPKKNPDDLTKNKAPGTNAANLINEANKDAESGLGASNGTQAGGEGNQPNEGEGGDGDKNPNEPDANLNNGPGNGNGDESNQNQNDALGNGKEPVDNTDDADDFDDEKFAEKEKAAMAEFADMVANKVFALLRGAGLVAPGLLVTGTHVETTNEPLLGINPGNTGAYTPPVNPAGDHADNVKVYGEGYIRASKAGITKTFTAANWALLGSEQNNWKREVIIPKEVNELNKN